jgi:hypothetical protein
MTIFEIDNGCTPLGNKRIYRARSPHACSGCGRVIQAGEWCWSPRKGEVLHPICEPQT